MSLPEDAQMDERDLEERLLGHNPLADDDVVFSELFRSEPAPLERMPAPVRHSEPLGPAAYPEPRHAPPRRELEPVPPQPDFDEAPLLDQPPPRRRKTAKKHKPRPSHYRIVSFSLYLEDIARLEDLVRQLKDKGHTKANKSQVIRYALAMVDIDKMPRSY